ncbi:MAG: hypothetical protein IKY44_00370 [Clostridia bacterium]|nr:hypothetical protein [Clostridia bacterium]
MKRIVAAIVISLVMMLALPLCAFGEVTDSYVSEQLEAVGADELFDSLSQETQELFESIGIDSIDYEQIINVSPSTLLNMFITLFKTNIRLPLGMLALIGGIMLASAVIQSFTDGLQERKAADIFNLVSGLVIGVSLVVPIGQCISEVSTAIKLSSSFMTAFIPVFVTVIIAAGKPLAALSFNGMVFTLAEVITYVSNSFIVPIVSGFLGLSLVGSFSVGIRIDNVIAFSKRCVTVVMGFMSTVFVGLICMKGFVATAADTVGTKASKFLLGNFLPVVGGAMGEAMSTVRVCLGLVKSSVGAFGMIGILLIYVPVIISLLSWQLVLSVSKLFGEMLGIGSVVSVIKAISSTLSLLLAVLVFSTFLLIISISVILMARGG